MCKQLTARRQTPPTLFSFFFLRPTAAPILSVFFPDDTAVSISPSPSRASSRLPSPTTDLDHLSPSFSFNAGQQLHVFGSPAANGFGRKWPSSPCRTKPELPLSFLRTPPGLNHHHTPIFSFSVLAPLPLSTPCVRGVTLDFRSFTASAVVANSPMLGLIRLDADLNKNLASSQDIESGKSGKQRGNRPSLQTGELDKTVIFSLSTLSVLRNNDAAVSAGRVPLRQRRWECRTGPTTS
ncbi:hypothetical protein E6C27_scaffold2379G00310 [Cucumis melo var. makuwa]|uniref:Uncharacterized protein n=1 Tax=Cucumis melo var. makuwa TaxID=1194695 RepID=A0A5A7TDY3_CUCMM|nr:hypothetical protein E6C27_scaffold2379G00310 [Cucumis melo var. makuwa]